MIFKRELAEKVMRGEKTATRRRMSDNPRSPWYRDHCAYEVGQVFAVQPGRGKPRVGNARVTDVYPQMLGQMEEPDARAEGFQGDGIGTALYAFDQTWEDLNGGYNPAEVVWAVEFEAVSNRD